MRCCGRLRLNRMDVGMISKKCSHGESFLSCQVNIVFEIPLPATRFERPLCDWKTTDRCEHFITREKGVFRPGGNRRSVRDNVVRMAVSCQRTTTANYARKKAAV